MGKRRSKWRKLRVAAYTHDARRRARAVKVLATFALDAPEHIRRAIGVVLQTNEALEAKLVEREKHHASVRDELRARTEALVAKLEALTSPASADTPQR